MPFTLNTLFVFELICYRKYLKIRQILLENEMFTVYIQNVLNQTKQKHVKTLRHHARTVDNRKRNERNKIPIFNIRNNMFVYYFE